MDDLLALALQLRADCLLVQGDTHEALEELIARLEQRWLRERRQTHAEGAVQPASLQPGGA